MKICSRHAWSVMLCMVLMTVNNKVLFEKLLLEKGYEWKQLVLPGFDTIMGV